LLHKVEGIVIRTNDYGETNKIVTLYTRELGKVGVMARGAKKPKSRLSSISQLFTYGQFLILKSSGLGTLQQGEIIKNMRTLREDLYATAYGACVIELTDKLTEEGKQNPFVFELLEQTLTLMSEGTDLDILLFIFETKMLQVAGISPRLDNCSCCGATEGHFSLSLREGGLLCQKCQHRDPYGFKLSQGTVKLLRLFQYFDLRRLGKISVKDETKSEIEGALTAYYDQFSGIHLKSKRFLKQLKNM
jgi:DNA repair protein RecO (recombination protein O)